ncbi:MULTISPECIES: LETM1-related biofilm-associated protein [unclassified Myroides]|uniref:LETM1-related biofilm-associated protein n=1 Tax=unclassified Myroides TaxID=2642485 RepID=UPI003D2F5F23
MNPSTTGWIKKYFAEHDKYAIFKATNVEELAHEIRTTGFSFGQINASGFPDIYTSFNYTQEEFAKICFLQLLEKIYFFQYPTHSTEEFIRQLLDFYQLFVPHKTNFFTSLFEDKNTYARLEHLFAIKWKENFFSQSKSNSIALNLLVLSIYLLTFETYLAGKIHPNLYHVYIEDLIQAILNQTNHQKNADLHRVDNPNDFSIDEIMEVQSSYLEMSILLDLVLCSSWNNETKTLTLPNCEVAPFERLSFSAEQIEDSRTCFMRFVQQNDYNYVFLKSSNLFNNMINNSTNYVEFLVSRNKGRILKEIQKNKQLMQLLMDSTHRNLDMQEKKLIKKQTLEVIKTIPSLAIFLLPGGTILLPIILKFIPSLLPSSFNENLESD